MPCHVEPYADESEREQLNYTAHELLKVLRGWFGYDEEDIDMEAAEDWSVTHRMDPIDSTGLLCAKIHEIGEDRVLAEAQKRFTSDKNAMELIGWWYSHKKYDERWGRIYGHEAKQKQKQNKYKTMQEALKNYKVEKNSEEKYINEAISDLHEGFCRRQTDSDQRPKLIFPDDYGNLDDADRWARSDDWHETDFVRNNILPEYFFYHLLLEYPELEKIIEKRKKDVKEIVEDFRNKSKESKSKMENLLVHLNDQSNIDVIVARSNREIEEFRAEGIEKIKGANGKIINHLRKIDGFRHIKRK